MDETLVKPDRDPDAICGNYRYWYEPEMVVCDGYSELTKLFLVPETLYAGGISDGHKLFEEHQRAYQMYLADKILLEEE